ncbi:hypothetical protein [Novosphingobium gossypii]|uniref:hypothetical protein n=1 Tax=Novosphingobium gossypii TaxID=1604774 RepID=UPI003D22CC84
MLNSVTRASRVLRSSPAPDPRLPHPSWRNARQPAPGDAALAIRNAGDFWSRLGL